MNRFFPSVISALALASVGCSVGLDDGRYACERGPCPPHFFCHSDNLCYATEEADAHTDIDALGADAFVARDATVDALDGSALDSSALDSSTVDSSTVDSSTVDAGLDAPMDDTFAMDTFAADASDAQMPMDDAPDAFMADAFRADAFSPDAFSPDAYIRPDAGRDVGTDVGNDATLTREFFTPCTTSSGCASGLCYFPNGERYATGYCTPMCTRVSTCPSMANVCQSNACVVTCSSSMLCPLSTRCALSDRSAGECLAPGVAPLPLAATPCSAASPCALGVCEAGVCRRACLNASGCPDTERCVSASGSLQICMP